MKDQTAETMEERFDSKFNPPRGLSWMDKEIYINGNSLKAFIRQELASQKAEMLGKIKQLPNDRYYEAEEILALLSDSEEKEECPCHCHPENQLCEIPPSECGDARFNPCPHCQKRVCKAVVRQAIVDSPEFHQIKRCCGMCSQPIPEDMKIEDHYKFDCMQTLSPSIEQRLRAIEEVLGL